jgi:hypothetical protein
MLGAGAGRRVRLGPESALVVRVGVVPGMEQFDGHDRAGDGVESPRTSAIPPRPKTCRRS